MRLSKARLDRLELLAADRVDTPERQAIRADASRIAGDGMEFARWAYRQTAASELIVGPHHVAMQDTLQRVIDGEIKRLIINVPPGYTKTLFATQYMIARGLALNPKARFLHLSYSHSLALLNSSSARRIIKAKSFQERWPMALRDDTDSKAMWWTNAGGGVYATSSGGQVTGFRAGHMEPGWNGCFTYDTPVSTNIGAVKIGDIVTKKIPVLVESYNHKSCEIELQPIDRLWTNPPSKIIRVTLSDGVQFECTPNHEIWTESGWVQAESLCPSHRLPSHAPKAFKLRNSYTEAGGNLFPAFGLAKNNAIWNVGHRVSIVPTSVRKFGCDGLPSLARLNLVNDANTHAKPSGEIGRTIGAGEYLDNFSTVELCSRSPFQQRKCSVSYGVLHVVGLCAPCKIDKAVISRNTIEVTPFLFWAPSPTELLKHKLMDKPALYLAANGQADGEVPLGVADEAEHYTGKRVWGAFGWGNGSCDASYSSVVADFVESSVSSYRTPVLIEDFGHADSTYCLEVRCNHNFYLAKGQVLVKNCLLIDDPVKPDDAFSQVRREGVNDGFNETIKSRLAIEDTPLIVIMQRIHHNDLSGYLLRGGSGEKWHHLCLPVIIDNAAPYPMDYTHGIKIEHGLEDGWLWPYKHNAKHLDALKAHRRTFEAQYMQAPRKFSADGALWTEAMLSDARELMVSDDSRSRCVVGVDPAVTSEATSDETGIVVASAHGRKRYSVDGDYSGRYTPQGWARKAMQAAKEHDADAIVAEVNQGGDMVESTLRACGYKGRVIKVRASKGKFARAEPISAMYAQGEVAHRGDLYALESQMLEYVPSDSAKSPDRLDAMVWALTELAPAGKQAGIFV